MKRRCGRFLIPAGLGTLWLFLSPAAAPQNRDRAEVALKAAMDKEVVEGDLKTAIELYGQLAQGSDRAVAASALVRMGQCYEKLGSAEARKAYERVVSNYTDQPEAAAQARARLAAMGSPPAGGVVLRQVWKIDKAMAWGTVSPDGRYISYVDWDTGNLALHDLVTGSDRHVTNKGTWAQSEEWNEESVISRDGKQVAYNWFSKDRRGDLRVLGLNGGSPAAARVLCGFEAGNYIAPYDWSPDGRWIVAGITRKGPVTQVGLVSTVDGSLRVLKSWPSSDVGRVFFSPDGKYLAFDRPTRLASGPRDLFVMTIDGSGETPVAVSPANDVMMGWAPDGRHLLFLSDRSGRMGIWAVPFGAWSQGGPKLIREDAIEPWSMGMTRSGALFYMARMGAKPIYVASLNFSTGKVMTPPTKFAQTSTGATRQPQWSPDGRFLAYKSHRSIFESGSYALVIRSVETGETRELHPDLQQLVLFKWSPDGRFFAAYGYDAEGRRGIFRIDGQTGAVATIALEGRLPLVWGPGGKSILFQRPGAFIERDLATGKEREAAPKGFTCLQISPDDSRLACLARDSSTKQSLSLNVVPIGGGPPRELARLQPGESFSNPVGWTPDGRSILVGKYSSAKKREIWLYPVSGGQPQEIDLPWCDDLSINPKSNQVAFSRGENLRGEIWVMENFLPASTPTR